jgi:hypothetical protein
MLFSERAFEEEDGEGKDDKGKAKANEGSEADEIPESKLASEIQVRCKSYEAFRPSNQRPRHYATLFFLRGDGWHV